MFPQTYYKIILIDRVLYLLLTIMLKIQYQWGDFVTVLIESCTRARGNFVCQKSFTIKLILQKAL